MKKIIFLVLSSLFMFPPFTSAQFISGFGVKAGATLSNQNYDYSINYINIDTKLKPGFNASLFTEFLNCNYFNLTLESGYDQRGYILLIPRVDEFGNPIGTSEYKNRTDYIFTALGAKLKYKSRLLTPYLQLQPRVSFYLGYNTIFPDDVPEQIKNLGDPILEGFKKTMFDVGFGAGLEFNRLLPYKVFIEANYNPGLINSFGNSFVKVKEYSFNFKAGINFIKEKQKKSRK